MLEHPWLILLGTAVVAMPIMVFAYLRYIRADYRRINKSLRMQNCAPIHIAPFDEYSPPTLADHAAAVLFHSDNRSRIYVAIYEDADGNLVRGVCETASLRGVQWLERSPYTEQEEGDESAED